MTSTHYAGTHIVKLNSNPAYPNAPTHVKVHLLYEVPTSVHIRSLSSDILIDRGVQYGPAPNPLFSAPQPSTSLEASETSESSETSVVKSESMKLLDRVRATPYIHIQKKAPTTDKREIFLAYKNRLICKRVSTTTKQEADDEDLTCSSQSRLVDCAFCNIPVPIAGRRQHIYTHHSTVKFYQCPVPDCSFGHSYHRANVSAHIKMVHRSEQAPVSIKKKYDRQIDEWMYRCFADRRLLKYFDPDVVSVVMELVVNAETLVQKDSMRFPQTQCKSETFDAQMPDDLLELEDTADPLNSSEESKYSPSQYGVPGIGRANIISPNAMKLVSSIDNLPVCEVCGRRGVAKKERHVLQHHLNLPVFCCPFCNFYNTYALSAVKDHIKSRHAAEKSRISIIDNRRMFYKDIKRMYEACFPPHCHSLNHHDLCVRSNLRPS